jgi:hypothetical protein
MRFGIRTRVAAIAAGAVAVIGAGTGVAVSLPAAVTAAPAVSHQLNRVQLDAATVTSLPGSVRAVCVNPSNGDVAWFEISNVPHNCAQNLLLITWGTQGPAGPAGPQGPAGPAGSAGASSVVQAAATTTVTNWPEGGGWGTDAFTRVVDVTVQGQVNNSHCGGAPVCYSVFGTLTDSAGSTVPANGHASPNGSSSATIDAAHISHIAMAGQADFQFYATSNKAAGSNVPATANGSAKPASTTDWGELAFPSGTQFFGATLTQYDWLYTASVAYTVSGSTNVSCTQTWNDQINPGDDGQGSADGNITGTCPVS